MRRSWLIGIVAVLALGVAVSAMVLAAPRTESVVRACAGATVEREGSKSADEREAEGPCAELAELQEPGDAILSRQLFGSDGPPTGAMFEAAAARSDALGRETAASAPTVAAARWENVGPTNVGGRVLDVAVDPERADTIFVAAATGGVWRSTDAGTTFSSAWPETETQAIGALTITPGGTLFAGTGETGPGGGSLTYGGTGVYRSRDRGASWQRVGLPDSSRVSRIVVDPTDEDRIFVAASGPLFAPGGERGLYRSEDGGDTWSRVLEGDNGTTGATDVAIKPDDPNVMLAAMWDHRREPDVRRYTGPGSGVYRSTDGGTTWTRITTPPTFGPNQALGRIGVAFAPSDPDVAFAVLSGESGAGLGMYKSLDAGETWVPLPDPQVNANAVVYGWWFGRVWVDPRDADHVFSAGLDLIESKDGGVSFAPISGPHADQHALAWDPKRPGRVYLGNDAGVYRSEEDGADGSFEFAKSQPISQLYGLDVGEQDPGRLVAGLQDNGVIRNYGGKTPGEFNQYGGGDGERTLINPRDQDIVYGCSQYGECFVSDDGGDSQDFFTEEVVSTRKNWFTPIEFDPEDPSIVYTGGEILSRSEDDAQTWTPISPDLSDGPGRETNPLFRNFGTLTTIAPAPKATGIIYVGTDDGNLWYTRDGGGAWTQADDPDLPEAWITRVEVDRANPDVAYATYSGFRSQDDSASLFRTADGGESWEAIGAALPRAPLNDVNAIGSQLVVASDVGVFLSRDTGRTWLRLGDGLPTVPVFELRHHAPTGALFAGTFGRGIYKVELPEPGSEPGGGDGGGGGGGAGGGSGGGGANGPAAPAATAAPAAPGSPGAATARRARIRIPAQRVRLRGRTATVRLACTGGVTCRGTLRVRVRDDRRRPVRSFRIASGRTATVRVRLSSRQLAILRRSGRRRIAARARLVGQRAEVGRYLTVRRARR